MSDNAQAILVFCSRLSLGDGIRPLAPSEWGKISRELQNKKLEPKDLLKMSSTDLAKQFELAPEMAQRLERLRQRSASLSFEISRYENIGISLITRADAGYPSRIKQKLGNNCPPFFFYAGDLSLLKNRGIGFVGSRHLSPEDEKFEQKLAQSVVEAGFVLVSGGSRGADEVAETVALENNGALIEFLGEGMIQKLRKSKIVQAVQRGQLLLLSVPNPDAGFLVGNAMGRNKFIYCQSEAVVAVKSINKGGTWQGVRESLRRNFAPVLCWFNPQYPENLALIKEGATGIDEQWDAEKIEEWLKKQRQIQASKEQKQLKLPL